MFVLIVILGYAQNNVDCCSGNSIPGINGTCHFNDANEDRDFLLSNNSHKSWFSHKRKEGVVFYDSSKTVSFFDENYFHIPVPHVDVINYYLDSDTICFKYRSFSEKQMNIESFQILELSDSLLRLYNAKWDTISLCSYIIQDTLPLTNPELSNDFIKAQPLFCDSDVVSILINNDIEINDFRNYRLVLYVNSQGLVDDAMILRNMKATLPSTIEEQNFIAVIKKHLRFKPAYDKGTGRNLSTKILFEINHYF